MKHQQIFCGFHIREIWLNASVRRRPLPMKVDESTGWLGALWNYVGWFVEVYLFSILSPPTFRVCVWKMYTVSIFVSLLETLQAKLYIFKLWSEARDCKDICFWYFLKTIGILLVSGIAAPKETTKITSKGPSSLCKWYFSVQHPVHGAFDAFGGAFVVRRKNTWCPDSFGLFLDLRWYKLFRKEWFETF